MTPSDPTDRNGEPAEADWGCITMAVLVALAGLVTVLIVLLGTR